MLRKYNELIVASLMLLLAVIVPNAESCAQNSQRQVEFNHKKVTLKYTGRRIGTGNYDFNSGQINFRELPQPVRIDSVDVTEEQSPYKLGEKVFKKIIEIVCSGKYLKAMETKVLSDRNKFSLYIYDIVVSPDGSVAYYKFEDKDISIGSIQHKASNELKLAIDTIIKQSCKSIKNEFKEPYLLLHVNIRDTIFRLQNGKITLDTGFSVRNGNQGDNTATYRGLEMTMQQTGKKDTIGESDPVTGEIIKKVIDLPKPVQIEHKPVSVEKSPYPISGKVQQQIVEAICRDTLLKSFSKNNKLPEGVFKFKLVDIVITPEGKVAYHNFWLATSTAANETRIFEFSNEMDGIIRESCKLVKGKFKDAYLLLNVDLSKYKFTLHNGVITASKL